MKHLIPLASAAALAFTPLVALAQTAGAETAQTDTMAAEAVMLTATVKGMVCDFCARAVSKVFSRNEAVESVHVDLDLSEIHVMLKPGADLSDADVADMIEQSGYALVSIEREAA